MSKPLQDPNATNAETVDLTRSQLLLYVGQQLAPDVPLYNMALAFTIRGPLDLDRFQVAWQTAFDQTDALRTVFTEESGTARQKVLPAVTRDVAVQDFSSEPAPEKAAEDWLRRRSRKRFVMGEPMFDTVLLRIAPDETIWFLNQHHLITDAWATALLFRRVGALYRDSPGARSGEPAPDPPQYADYIRFERAQREGEAHRRNSDYWRSKLAGAPEPPRLYHKPRRQESTPSTRVTRRLGATLSTRIRHAASLPELRSFTPHLSLYNFFTALLFAYLNRVSRQSHLAIGTPAHNRPSRKFKETAGVFIELFPLHANIDGDETFASLIRKTQSETADFLRHATPGASDPAYNRCFNVVLNYINATFGDFAGMPTASEWIHAGHCDVGHHLRLQVHDFDATGQFDLHFDFNDGVFQPEERTLAIDHFLALLDGCLANPERPLRSLPLIGSSERFVSIEQFNAPSPAPLPDRSIVDLFESVASENADRVAIEAGDQRLTYAELDRRANIVAARLAERHRGSLEGCPVGFCMRRGPELVAAMLGILKAGGSFVPLDIRNPARRHRQIAEDAPLSTILTTRESLPALSGIPGSVETVTIDEWIAAPAPDPAPPGRDSLRLDSLAYILYTSGSTGIPKGVAITHAGLADYITWAARSYVRGDTLRFPFFTSPGFDLTLTSLFLPLVTGGTLIVYPDNDRPVDTAVLDVLAENRVDAIKLTPSHLQMALKAGFPADCKIKRMIVGGEDFKTGLARATQERVGESLEIYNEYGPTEAVVGCMIHQFESRRDTGASVPIGKPADHVEIYVLDDDLQPVPRGVPGELCIARHGLADGYHGAAAATQNHRFVPHPFRDGAMLYRTGDLARFHNPSSLEFLGRIDRQLKLSGFRVEPAEVERALESHPAIEAAVVTVRKPVEPATTATTGTGTGPDIGRAERRCVRCGIPSNYPGIRFDRDGVCHICAEYSAIEPAARAYFKSMPELEQIFAESRRNHPEAKYDCMALLSGGKDSTYALYRLIGLGLRVHAFTLDNGYLSPEAKANVRRVVDSLGIEHEFGSTPEMAAIFRDSLSRFSNVCNGCFKTVYTLGMNRARSLGIPIIVTGLSRGQFFETRLTADLFRDNRFSADQMDEAVHAARIAYHQADDAVSRLLDTGSFRDGSVFQDVRVIDFYRYCDVSVGELLRFLEEHAPWIRPSDTGRSTNCLINDVGIYIHKKERGYHNYALPYSWDVRMGHKTRDQAIHELEDEIDIPGVRRILAEIGYDENRLSRENEAATLVGYYQSRTAIPHETLRAHLGDHVPGAWIPSHFVRLDEIPLTSSGKLDHAALPEPGAAVESTGTRSAPAGPVEERIAEIWKDVLRIATCDAESSFFVHGGASLQAMDAMVRICEAFGVQLPLQSLFQAPTIRQLAALVEAAVRAEIEAMDDTDVERALEGSEP